MKKSRYVTIMLIPEGGEQRTGFRIQYWVLKTGAVLAALLVITIAVFIFFSTRLMSQAATADTLQKENDELRRYQYKVTLLEQNLRDAREVVTRLTELAGIDYTFPELPDDSVLFAQMDEQTGAVVPRAAGRDWSMPTGLPIDGFISQEFNIEQSNQYHPGIDIACAEGTPVLATAAGHVAYAAFDSTYGFMIVLQHNDSVQSLYGHNQKLLVQQGQDVLAGSRIALSGNTGVSTAPHLHYEIRINDEPINPLEVDARND